MDEPDRVVTAKLPGKLVSKMDEIGARMERSKSWIVKQAVAEWIAEEDRRHQLTLEGLKSVDEGKTIPQEEVEAWFEEKRRARAKDSR